MPHLQRLRAAGLTLALAMSMGAGCGGTLARPQQVQNGGDAVIRFATYNVSLQEPMAGGLVDRLQNDDAPARRVAAVIQRVRPDVLLLNEFDHDPDATAVTLFQRDYLEQPQFGERAIAYPYRFVAPVNTGVDSGFDLDRDGATGGPGDAWGYGAHPGQYGMVVLSRYPIAHDEVRTFRGFRWRDLPGALQPRHPGQASPWYDEAIWARMPLSSKSHWDVPVNTPQGPVRFLVAHPTPPVFDGPEDRNGRRNHDEIRFWAEYVSAADAVWITDDQGRRGGLPASATFVIAGDYNADPQDGDSWPGAIEQLLSHPRVEAHPAPRSMGAIDRAAELAAEVTPGRGDPALHTGNFGAPAGNLRVDYVLPSTGLRHLDGGVFWPRQGEPGHQWVDASDHHLVWIDVQAGSAVRQRN